MDGKLLLGQIEEQIVRVRVGLVSERTAVDEIRALVTEYEGRSKPSLTLAQERAKRERELEKELDAIRNAE